MCVCAGRSQINYDASTKDAQYKATLGYCIYLLWSQGHDYLDMGMSKGQSILKTWEDLKSGIFNS